jgi:hypothetical protein
MTDPADVLRYDNEAALSRNETILGEDALEYGKGPKPAKRVDKCKDKAPSGELIVVAGGWAYPTVAEEIEAIAKDTWQPTTADFLAMANVSLGRSRVYEATSASTFLGAIDENRTVGRIVFIGHGGVFGLVFGGTPGAPSSGATLGESELRDLSGQIAVLRSRLPQTTRIELICCTLAINEMLCLAMAAAFDRCVRALPTQYEVRNPTVDKGQVKSRGFTRLAGQSKYLHGWRHLRRGLKSFPPPTPTP